VRVLGRFLAEAPESHSEDFRTALPFMLRLGLSSHHERGAGEGRVDVQEVWGAQCFPFQDFELFFHGRLFLCTALTVDLPLTVDRQK
jgi:hypothetical protein